MKKKKIQQEKIKKFAEGNGEEGRRKAARANKNNFMKMERENRTIRKKTKSTEDARTR